MKPIEIEGVNFYLMPFLNHLIFAICMKMNKLLYQDAFFDVILNIKIDFTKPNVLLPINLLLEIVKLCEVKVK